MNRIPLFQQDLEKHHPAANLKLCAPTALYELALRKGYDMPEPEEFVNSLDWENGWDHDAHGWKRKELCRMFRNEYGVQSATWWSKFTGHPQNSERIDAMRSHGYIETDEEQAYLESLAFQLSIADIALKDSIVATVEVGFSQNMSAHAVIIEKYNPSTRKYRVFDPDSRNHQLQYPKKQFEKFLAVDGAITTIIDPS